MTGSIYRVTVRGRFGTLDEPARRFLAAEQANHDIFKSAFTSEGSFTYVLATKFFNLRYEVRTSDGPVAAGEQARVEATRFLNTMFPRCSFPGSTTQGPGSDRSLKVDVFDTSAVWDDR